MPLTLENTRPLREGTRPQRPPSVDLVVTTDGRIEYLQEAVKSLGTVEYPWARRILVNDAAQPVRLRGWDSVDTGGRQGLAAAVRAGWAAATADFVFHFEDDFVLAEPVDITAMVRILTEQTHLVELSLMRQPWSPLEKNCGAVVAAAGRQHFRQCEGWFEHRRYFTLNPSLIPRRTYRTGWPPTNEKGMAERLFADPTVAAGYLGDIDDPPRVLHIGLRRSQGWKP